MKVLVIPDVHGSHEWEAARRSGPADYDYVVFLGDYFDSWENEWPDQGENFRKICAFVREDTEHRKLLLGNHDWSYLSRTKYGSGVSGHQNSHIDEIRTLLSENHDILDIKSREFAAADYSKESALKNLSEAFGEKLSERYYRMFF